MSKKDGFWLGITIVALIVIIKNGIAIYNNFQTNTNTKNNYSVENKLDKKVNKDNVVKSQNSKNNDKQVTQEAQVNQDATSKLKDYLYQNFGGNGNKSLETSWYSLIKDAKVYTQDNYSWVIISTDIYRDEEGKKIALPIANAALFWDEMKIKSVTVNDKDGYPLIVKDNPNE